MGRYVSYPAAELTTETLHFDVNQSLRIKVGSSGCQRGCKSVNVPAHQPDEHVINVQQSLFHDDMSDPVDLHEFCEQGAGLMDLSRNEVDGAIRTSVEEEKSFHSRGLHE